nr:phage minor head protein [Agrobacterium sp. Ap1]
MIGLSPGQAELVLRLRNGLIQADKTEIAKYLGYKLRNRQYDAVARRAAAEGWDAALAAFNKGRSQPLTKAQIIARIVDAYKDRSIKARADLIAENETLTAMRAGRHEGYRQLLDSGTVRDDQIERTWDAANDKKTRLSHQALDNQKQTGLSQPFISPVTGAQMMFPGDRSLGAPTEEIIRCRCFERVRIRYIR